MSDEHGKSSANESELERLVADALAESDELFPSTEAEVERAEARGVEHEGPLPEALQRFSRRAEEPAPESRAEVRSLDEARRARTGRSVGTHLIAVALGAAAASLLFWSRTPSPTPGAGTPSVEPPKPLLDAGAPDARLTLAPLPSCGSDCCAGAECAAAKDDLSQCSSGRRCVPCSAKSLGDVRFRLRLGAFAPLDAGRKLLSGTQAGFTLCARVGSSPLACTEAHEAGDETDAWSELPLAVSVQDLLAGLTVEVRLSGTQQVVAQWSSPVQVNAHTLCKGLFVKPKTPKDEALGTVSLFLDDTSWVELARGATVDELRAERARFELGSLPAKVFETERAGAERFALVLGPFERAAADAVRWDVVQKGGDARVVAGRDYRGRGLALP